MKKIVVLSLLLLSIGAFSQGYPGCAAIDAGADKCATPCADLTATFTGLAAPTSYSVTAIPYAPYAYSGTPVNVSVDDIWSPKIPLGFPFCYFGNTYTDAQIGANGQLTFTTMSTLPGDDNYIIRAALPSTLDMPGNTICAAFRDIDPSQPGSATYVHTIGTAPCRTMVISWVNTPLFSYNCSNSLPSSTYQLVLYENSNYIDIYIQNSSSCSLWNSGYGIVGIQNANATVAVVPPNHNFPIKWSATNEAWRFTPTGSVPPATITWTGPGNTTVGTGTTINVCPATTTTYTATATYVRCGGISTSLSDQVTVRREAPPVLSFTVKPLFCAGEPIVVDGTASTNITPKTFSGWEIAECDQAGNVIPGGYITVSLLLPPNNAVGVFTFPGNPPCNKYYRIKLTSGNSNSDACQEYAILTKVVYVACTCPCGTSFTNPCDLGTICSKTTDLVANTDLSIYSDNYSTNKPHGQPSKDIWYKFKPQNNGRFEINTCGSTLADTYIHLLDEFGNEIAYNDDQEYPNVCTGYLLSRMNSKNTGYSNIPLSLIKDKTYYLVLEGYSSNQGPIKAQITCCLPCVNTGDGSSYEKAYDLCEIVCQADITKNNGDAIFSNTYGTNMPNGQPSNDIWYTFTITTSWQQWWYMSTCGSSFNDTYMHLLRADKSEIYSNDVGVKPCASLGKSSMDGTTNHPTPIMLDPGTYYVVVEGKGMNTGSIRLFINKCIGFAAPESLDITQTKEFALQVYPNPFTNTTTFKVEGNEGLVQVEITNTNGVVVYKNEGMQTGEVITLGEAFPSGVYFVKVNNNAETKVMKLVKLQ